MIIKLLTNIYFYIKYILSTILFFIIIVYLLNYNTLLHYYESLNLSFWNILLYFYLIINILLYFFIKIWKQNKLLNIIYLINLFIILLFFLNKIINNSYFYYSYEFWLYFNYIILLFLLFTDFYLFIKFINLENNKNKINYFLLFSPIIFIFFILIINLILLPKVEKVDLKIPSYMNLNTDLSCDNNFSLIKTNDSDNKEKKYDHSLQSYFLDKYYIDEKKIIDLLKLENKKIEVVDIKYKDKYNENKNIGNVFITLYWKWFFYKSSEDFFNTYQYNYKYIYNKLDYEEQKKKNEEFREKIYTWALLENDIWKYVSINNDIIFYLKKEIDSNLYEKIEDLNKSILKFNDFKDKFSYIEIELKDNIYYKKYWINLRSFYKEYLKDYNINSNYLEYSWNDIKILNHLTKKYLYKWNKDKRIYYFDKMIDYYIKSDDLIISPIYNNQVLYIFDYIFDKYKNDKVFLNKIYEIYSNIYLNKYKNINDYLAENFFNKYKNNIYKMCLPNIFLIYKKDFYMKVYDYNLKTILNYIYDNKVLVNNYNIYIKDIYYNYSLLLPFYIFNYHYLYFFYWVDNTYNTPFIDNSTYKKIINKTKENDKKIKENFYKLINK